MWVGYLFDFDDTNTNTIPLKLADITLDHAESLMIYAYQPEECKEKRDKPTAHGVKIENSWKHPDGRWPFWQPIAPWWDRQLWYNALKNVIRKQKHERSGTKTEQVLTMTDGGKFVLNFSDAKSPDEQPHH